MMCTGMVFVISLKKYRLFFLLLPEPLFKFSGSYKLNFILKPREILPKEECGMLQSGLQSLRENC